MYERCHSGYLRQWAVDECLKQIQADDEFTHCISIGPVSIATEQTDCCMSTPTYMDAQTCTCRYPR